MTTTPSPPPPIVARRTRATLRTVATVHGVAIFVQPVAAGLLLTGFYEALGWHATGADVVSYLGLLQLVVAAVFWWRGGPRWPTAGAALVVVAETGQHVAGQDGALDLHLPLGVALVAGTALYVVALWSVR